MQLAGLAVSALALAGVLAFSRTRLACFIGHHRDDAGWRDTGEEPDEAGRIFVARRCVRCGRETDRVPLNRQWSFGGAVLYGRAR